MNAIGRWKGFLGAGVACLTACVGAAPAHARDAIVTSFDGTPIKTNFFPAAGPGSGKPAPTIMVGPGWGSPGETDPGAASIGPLLRDGYNVLTWDPRGFHGSGGAVNIDSPHFEARDAQALIDFIARQPEALMERADDPVLGMSGVSYGGAVQYITAARDDRVDAIAPTIAWNQLTRALLGAFEGRDAVGPVKTGWGAALAGLGVPMATLPGVFSPAGVQQGSLAPQFFDAIASGLATGTVSAQTRSWFADHGPDRLLDEIDVPTLITQGTVDTLFTLEEAHRNFVALERRGVPVKMLWFCGGHGICRTGGAPEGGLVESLTGDGGLALRRKLAWFDRWLRGNRGAQLGPAFEWPDESGRVLSSRDYPEPESATATGRGSGLLTLIPGESVTSGLLILATPDPLALKVPIQTPPAGSRVTGSPRLTATYRATGGGLLPGRRTYVYAQIVDQARNVVVGNFATPIPITLDGQPHTVSVELERIASRSLPAGYRLELTQQSNVYDVQRAAGVVDFDAVDVTLPLSSPVSQPSVTLSRRCLSRGRLRVALTGQTHTVREVSFKRGTRRLSRDTRAAFERTLSARTLRRSASRRLRAVVSLADGEQPSRVVLARTLPRCGR